MIRRQNKRLEISERFLDIRKASSAPVRWSNISSLVPTTTLFNKALSSDIIIKLAYLDINLNKHICFFEPLNELKRILMMKISQTSFSDAEKFSRKAASPIHFQMMLGNLHNLEIVCNKENSLKCVLKCIS